MAVSVLPVLPTDELADTRLGKLPLLSVFLLVRLVISIYECRERQYCDSEGVVPTYGSHQAAFQGANLSRRQRRSEGVKQ